MRRVEVVVRFYVNFDRDQSYSNVADSARKHLVEHSSTIPMLFKEVLPTDEHTIKAYDLKHPNE